MPAPATAPAAAPKVSRLPRPPRISETKQHYVNIMVYGRPGVGKTLFGATGPTPVFYLDCDDGLLSVENPLPELVKELALRPDELYSRPVRSFDQMTGIIRQLGQELRTEPGFWGTVVLDNLSELQRILMSELLNRFDPPLQAPRVQDWGVILSQMQGFVRAIKALPCHTVFIAHESAKEVAGPIPNTKIMEIAPALSGQIQNELPGYVDIVARYVLVEREKRQANGSIETETVRRLRCRPQVGSVSVVAKNRGGRLSDWEIPHFSQMINKITGH